MMFWRFCSSLWKAFGSDLDQNTAHPDDGLSFFQSLHVNAGILCDYGNTASFQIHSSSTFTSHPTIKVAYSETLTVGCAIT